MSPDEGGWVEWMAFNPQHLDYGPDLNDLNTYDIDGFFAFDRTML